MNRGHLFSPVMDTKVMVDPDTGEFSTKSSLGGKYYKMYSIFYGTYYTYKAEEGIHVYRESPILHPTSSRVIVRCTVMPEDIILANRDEICAKRVFLNKEDYDT